MFPPCAVRRDGREGSILPRRHTELAAERSERDAEPGRKAARPSARCVIRSAGSGKSSASSPKPGMLAVQPQSAGEKSSSSISSVSPGSAPSTPMGPFTWSTRVKSRFARSSTVEPEVIWPHDASSASNSTISPLGIVAIGSMDLSQARWN